MNSKRGPAVLTQELGEVIGDSLGTDEDKDLAVFLGDLVEMLDKLGSLFKVSADLDHLLDVVVGSQVHGSDVDLNEVVQEVHGKSLDFLGPSGREQQCLSVRSNLGDNLPDLRFETHVQHSVGFVHDKVGDSLKVGLAALEHVDQSTGSSDNDFGTSLQVSDLLTLGDTTVDSGVPDSGRSTKLGALGLSLHSEFSSGSKDKDNGTITGLKERLGVDVNHGWECERDGFTGTGFGDGDEVSSRQGHRPGLTLNSGRLGETGRLNFSHDVVGETGFVEGSDRSRHVGTLDLHFLFSSEGGDLGFGSLRHTFVLDVKVLLELG